MSFLWNKISIRPGKKRENKNWEWDTGERRMIMRTAKEEWEKEDKEE